MENEQKHTRLDDETKAFLARIRRTINASNELLAKLELRRAETDRLLEAQGLTREQVEAMSFTPEQMKAVNQELARRGLPAIEEEQTQAGEANSQVDSHSATARRATERTFDPGDTKEDLENRRRKFNMMMNNFRL
ncbi:MAG: hypothetical protein IKP00_12055 [Victivallales bacterium]|nr:hypothetical protein [Victivallales bacterium]